MSETRTASLNPADAVQGGFLDDADVIVEGAAFAIWDYNGKGKATTALRVTYKDGDDKLHEQYYSAGSPERYVPSDDGKKLLLTGTATGLSNQSNLVKYLTALVNAGFPVDKLGDDVSGLVGLRAHVNAVSQPRTNMQNEGDKDRTILLVTKIIALPGQKLGGGAKTAAGAGKTAAPKSTPTAAASAATQTDDTVAERVIGYIVAAAQAAGGSIGRAKISQTVFQLAAKAGDGDKANACKLAFSEEFLGVRAGQPVQIGEELVAFEYDPASKTIKVAELATA